MGTAPTLTNLATAIAALLLCTAATAQPASSPPKANRPAVTAGSLSGNSAAPLRCAAARKLYLKSQVCFNHYRIRGGGVKAEAYKHCRNVEDPSPRCGPDIPTR